jgi:hypothetical protein
MYLSNKGINNQEWIIFSNNSQKGPADIDPLK